MNVAPTLYHGANVSQRRDAEDIFKSYLKMLHWRNDGTDSVLDLGSGSGDVTIDFVLSSMPSNYEKLVGVDISEKMVQYANQKYSSAKVSFEEWDMCSDPAQVLQKHPGGFHHIVSNYSLQWAKDQEKAIQNAYDLLKPNGDCLLIVLSKHSTFAAWDMLLNSARWQPHMRQSGAVVGYYQRKEDPEELMKSYLKAAGFSEYHVETSSREFVYGSLAIIKQHLMSVSPYMKHIPPAEREEHFQDFVKAIFDLSVATYVVGGKDVEFHSKYQVMIVYAKK